MATLILVAGAFHGGWCWELVAPLLATRGHRVLAPDLPGMGRDRAPLAGDVLGRWVDATVAAVESGTGPAILVGHSRGGLVLGGVAQRVPDRVALAVFLAAALPRDGESAADTKMLDERFMAEFVPTADGDAVTVDPARAARWFYPASSPDVAGRAAARLTAEPVQPSYAPMRLTADRFGRVLRAFVETEDDAVFPIARQRAMQARWPCAPVVTLPSDHAPFFSMPERLAGVLDGLAERQAPP